MIILDDISREEQIIQEHCIDEEHCVDWHKSKSNEEVYEDWKRYIELRKKAKEENDEE